MNKNFFTLFTQLFLFALMPLAAQEEQMPAREQGMWQSLILIGIALLFFYFILWRPEQKKRKELEEKRNSLRKGDKVTAMGIIGKVVKVADHTVILSMHDGSKIEFLKAAVSDVLHGSDPEEKKENGSD